MYRTLCALLFFTAFLGAAPVPLHRENRSFELTPGVYEILGNTETTPTFRMLLDSDGTYTLKAVSTWDGGWSWCPTTRVFSFAEKHEGNFVRRYYYRLNNDLTRGTLLPESTWWYDTIRLKRLRSSDW